MLRDNTEQFAKDLSKFLSDNGIDTTNSSYQLLKAERLSPDVFVWLLQAENILLVTISDIRDDHPDKKTLTEWLDNHVTVDEIISIPNASGSEYMDNDFDTVKIYKLPSDYDQNR